MNFTNCPIDAVRPTHPVLRPPSFTTVAGTRWLGRALRKISIRAIVPLGLLVLSVIVGDSSTCLAGTVDELSDRDPVVARLSAPMKAIVDGVSFRDAVNQIASRAGVNIWISRNVDPTAKVEIGPLGPTGFAAIEQLAASRNCVAHLIAGVVLVGPAGWVDDTTAGVLNRAPKPPAIADVTWPVLSTPQQALAAAGEAAPTNDALPYDLWPATTWTQIDRAVAIELVKRQFPTAPAKQPVARRYRSKDIEEVRKAIQQNDPKARVRVVDGALEVRAASAAHRVAAATMMRLSKPKPGADEPTFSLKVTTSARNALNQLCAAADRKCEIAPSAVEACDHEISIEEKDISLTELIKRVAAQVGVKATWTNKSVVFEKL